jgi:hypothetical protein
MGVASLGFLKKAEGISVVKNSHINTRKRGLFLISTVKNRSLVRPSHSLSLSVPRSGRDDPEVTG